MLSLCDFSPVLFGCGTLSTKLILTRCALSRLAKDILVHFRGFGHTPFHQCGPEILVKP